MGLKWFVIFVLITCFNNCRATDKTNGQSHSGTDKEISGELEGGHGDKSGNHSKGHGGIHVASWQYSYVQKPLLITIFIVLIAIIKIFFHHAHRLAAVIPESCVLILVGVLIGFLFLIREAKGELEFLGFEKDAFFLFLLPPIVLEAAYSLKDRAFVECLGTILLYAVFGTILNVLFVGPILYGFYIVGAMGNASVTFLECIIFAALVAAVDPVAVLAIFQEVGVNKVLYFMVFGESLFNVVEPIIVFGLAYLAYITAELFHFSGIIGIICCGLIQAHYAQHNVSSKSYISISYFSKVGSGVTESLIFIILGVMLVNDYEAWLDFNIGFAALSLLLCIISRFLVVFFLALCVNTHLSGIRKINLQEQFIMAYGGLRGAITFSLVFMLDPGLLGEGQITKNILYTSSYVIIFFTTFLQGITIKPLVKLMRIRLQSNDTNLFREINHAVLENGAAAIEEIIGHKGSYWLKLMAKHLSRRFLRPLLHKHPHKQYNSVLATYQEVSMQSKYTSAQVTETSTNQTVIWNELDQHDQLNTDRITHEVSSNELDRIDEHKESMRKQQKHQLRRRTTPTLPVNMRFDRASDLLQLHDLLKAAPHKTVHYVMDKNLTEEQSDRVKAQISNMSNVRRKKSLAGGTNTIGNQLLSTALLPMGMGMMLKRPSNVVKESIEMTTRQSTTPQNGSGTNKKNTSITVDENNATVTRIEVTPPEDPNDKSGDENVTFDIGL